MSSASPIALCLSVAALLAAWPASAQEGIDPGRGVDAATGAKPRTATSDLSATTPVQTPAERREAKALTTAIFARPSAAAKAAEKIDAANQPDLSAVQPKPEWTPEKSGLGVGGKGIKLTAPF
jgi:hypothetical protein